MISHKHHCVFIHIPKTAGRTIKSLFGLPELGRYYKGELEWIEDPFDHQSITKYTDRDWFDDYYKFSVIRNPWDRAVSAFFYLDKGGSNQFDQAFRDEYLAKYGGDFDAFAQDIGSLAEHKFFKPQMHWVGRVEEREVLCDHLIRFENLSEEVMALSERLGLPMPEVPHVNPGKHPPYQECYSPAGRDAVAEVYAADIEAFGYSF
ncbi:Sulfotransferase family protein [Methyloligella halotolerans]|uniref:Sulfotransferase family protein n=1 Tax=Methyloligella halotolerans TaxID=1177755 RepID=A0A1E2S2W2_9HYPH|nr:sulfotransferase family 2 domain-containing protein [Methyloligella halotolerans]ODA68665.1 Sulfotransferase family protein [Methyloligella halotolerans]